MPPLGNEKPHPDDHAAGQTPAAETEQPDYSPPSDLSSAIGDAQRALSDLHFNQSEIDPTPEQLDAVIEHLEAAIKVAKAHKREAAKES